LGVLNLPKEIGVIPVKVLPEIVQGETLQGHLTGCWRADVPWSCCRNCAGLGAALLDLEAFRRDLLVELESLGE